MTKKVVSDLEKMNKDRRKAEEEYLDSQQQMLEIQRIQREGITSVEELILYAADVIVSVTHSEDLARINNNPIVYSEAVGIRREFTKLLELVLKDGTAIPVEEQDGTEEAHRENNTGEEGYQ
jgi:hypothetical protein